MNRLVPAYQCSALTLAITLASSVVANAQVASSLPTETAAPGSAVSVPTVGSGQQLLSQVQVALARKDYHTAVQSFRQVAAIAKTVPQLSPGVEQARARLHEIGFEPALLNLPPAATAPSQPTRSPMQRLPQVAGAQPISGAAPASGKQEALRLIAIGRAALDRGDIKTAIGYAKQAESLKVPETEFAAGEPRVWQFVLDAESAARRSGVSLASETQVQGAANQVQQAYGTSPQADSNVIAQMFYNADEDAAAKGANGSVKPVQFTEQTSELSYAQRMYMDGLDLLSAGDSAGARKRFAEAWKYEADLTPAQRSQLKDKLTLLRPTRMASPQDAAEEEELTPLQKADLAAKEETRKMLRKVTGELVKVSEKKTDAPMDALDDLERLQRQVDESELDDASKRSLAIMVDRALADQKQYIDANRAKIDLDLQNQAVRAEIQADQDRELQLQEEISSLVDQFNNLMRERRFPEAEVIAKQVAELKPEDPIASIMLHKSQIQTYKLMGEELRQQKADSFMEALHDVDKIGVAPNPNLPLEYGDSETWEIISRSRSGSANDRDSRLSEAERAIKAKLRSKVSVKYANRPLGEVLDELSTMTSVPVVIDQRALSSVRVTTETPVSLPQLDSIELKSVLNLLLKDLELAYEIENDVLSITSLEAKRSNVYPQLYRVTDLVTPIPNFTSSYEDGLAGALRNAYQMTNQQPDVHIVPMSATDLGMGMARAMSPTKAGPDVLGQYSPMGAQGGFGLNNPPMSGGAGGGAAGGGSFADFQSLIDLIQTTVVPDTWEALGGPSTMAPYPQNLSLVISTTSDVHDQIVDLLESLRRLQNLQITIEVRFITLADTFAEQIGVDFNVQFDDNTQQLPTGEDSGPSVAVGFDGDLGLPTADLDIRFNNGSFGLTPPFGAAGLGTPSTIGFAILSDIEAFFFLQAAQSDNRSNVVQAPKVTMFDGQFATINDVSQRPFVTSITPVVGDFAVAQQPVIVVLNEGTQLNVQGIVSDDKRFVRLTLVPFFSQIGEVDTFTFNGRRTTRRTSRDEEDTNDDNVVDENDAVDEESEEDVIEGTTVQLPTFAFTSVSTTVSVPDGGTILLGGIKRLQEGRNERGVPIFSKIPYISRLFRNVSAGREARSLMLMVTPRIIIQEEEELAQTGFDPNNR